MVLRKLTMALLSLGVILPGLTHALAVREIKTKSALGEPFSAEVELTDIGDLTVEDIKVGLAQQEDFERLGIERVYFLTELRFDVVISGGRSVVKITSSKRVTEPFLDFIIRVSWPSNTRLQQVTTFLDPPVSVTKKEAPVTPQVVVVNPEPVIAPVLALPAPVINAEEMNVAASDSSYRVRKHDTLWSVARRLRPSVAVSVPKMMKILHKANPQAFIANNINLLKDGEVLRVPTMMDMQTPPTQTIAKTDVQVVQPQASSNKPLARQQIDATSTPKASLAVQKAPQAQMKLLAPTGGKIATAGTVTKQAPVSNKTTKPAVAGVAVVSKTIVKATGYNQKLSQELETLEHQLKLNDKKIAMQNAKLAQLEAQLKARRLAAQQAARHNKTVDKTVDKTALEKKALATMVCAVATQSFLTTEAKAAEPAVKEDSSMMPIIGGGLLVIIIAIIFFLKSKGKKQAPTRPAAPPAPAKPVTAQPVKAPEAAQPKPAPVQPKKPLDPLEEVQPYLEMERFPQAVGILTKALVQAPDRADLHLKLLEVFAKQKDRQSFDEQFAKLELLGELEATVEAEKLKSLLPAPAKPTPPKGESLEFERFGAKPAESAVPEASFSLDDLENDFKMSLSQPNLKALDIEIRPDPVSFDEPVIEESKVAEMDALFENSGLDFSFKKETKTEEPADLDMSFGASAFAEEEPIAKKSFDTGLSLDSLDDFLAEHKTDVAPALEVPKTDAPAVDFEQALASFKEEKQDDEIEFNLTEGFELEEFNVASEEPSAKIDSDFDALDVDFSIADHAQVEAKSDFDLGDIKAPVVEGFDLSDAAAAFDQETLTEEDLVDDLDLDFDVSVATDDVVADLDREFSFLATTDENATRLDLARAYMEMGDRMGARDLLEEVVAEGNGNQKNEAQGMLMRIG